MRDYSIFTVDDFLDDNLFIQGIRDKNPAILSFWINWQQTNPPNLSEYQKAVTILKVILDTPRMRPTDAQGAQLLADIDQAIWTAERRQQRVQLVRYVAGGLVTMLVLLAGLGWYAQSMITVQTGFGQRKQIVLPDQSRVTLNANSTLRYPRSWRWRTGRKVWLQGEAFLTVTHLNQDSANIQPNERFVVHTDKLDVNVLGTRFNVRDRRGITTVALVAGKVSVGLPNTNAKQAVVLKPGEVVSYQQGRLIRQATQQATNQPDAWVGGNLIVRGLTARQIIDALEDTYGYHIVLDDARLGTIAIEGTLPLNNPQTTLYMLANILNADIQQQGNTIHFSSR